MPLRLFLFISILLTNTYSSATELKNIATFEGVRDNLLVGRGLVVGLAGTGDNMQNSVFTQQELVSLLDKLGSNIQGSSLKTKNIAAVIVTAKLPPFIRPGTRADVTVSALGDAKSLYGGVLVATSMLGADGKVYAVAQGPIEINQYTPISDEVKTKSTTTDTKGFIPGGAIVENEVGFDFSLLENLTISLNIPDFNTALNVVNTINNNVSGNPAKAIDAGTISLILPKSPRKNVVEYLAKIESLPIEQDHKARIVISENTGTIVIGEKVGIRPVAIAQGNLMINIGKPGLNQKIPFMQEKQQNSISKGLDSARGSEIRQLEATTNLSELVNGLNKLGIWPRDMIDILRNMQAVGALDAVIEVR